MDYSGGNPGGAPPGYAEVHANASNVPYGQSTLLHGNEITTTQPNKPCNVPPPCGAAPYPPHDQQSGGYVPYGAPAYGYPMNPGYPPPRYAETAPVPQQQQQSVVVVTGHERRHPMLIGHVGSRERRDPVLIGHAESRDRYHSMLIGHVQSYAGHIIMACLVTFCCCFIFGIIAFILASEFVSFFTDKFKNWINVECLQIA